MTEHKLFYYPYASFTNAQLPLLKVTVLYFDKLVLLDPVGESWDTVGADHIARDAVRLLKDAAILEIVSLATVLAKYENRPQRPFGVTWRTVSSWSCATLKAGLLASSVGRSRSARFRGPCKPIKPCTTSWATLLARSRDTGQYEERVVAYGVNRAMSGACDGNLHLLGAIPVSGLET